MTTKSDSTLTGSKRTLDETDAKSDDGQPPPLKRQRRSESATSTNNTNNNSNDTSNDNNNNNNNKVDLYCSWFCPFAQRAWLALLLKKIEFNYNEIDPYNKTKEWLAINPRGLVPALRVNNELNEVIYESTIILEYLDDEYDKLNGKCDYNLFPNSSYKKAMARIWIDHISKKIIRYFYQILQFSEKDKRNKAIKDYFEGIDALIMAMDEEGPYFDGKEINAVDVTFLPWGARMFLLKHYRNVDYKEWIGQSLNKNENERNKLLQRYEKWWDACSNLKEFKETEADSEKLIGMYKRYADNTAESLVAVAVNKGEPLP